MGGGDPMKQTSRDRRLCFRIKMIKFHKGVCYTLAKISRCSLFPYYFKGGEILGLHYGSFFSNQEALLSRMKAEEEFITKSNRLLPTWIDFYETKLTDHVLTEFLESINRLRSHITKLAIVGCSSKDRRRLQRLTKKLNIEIPIPVKYFSDPEDAKTWLVSEAN